MSPGRLWRTVRHLTPEQWVYRAVCRGRRVLMRRAPGPSRRRIARAAARMPLPDPSGPAAEDIAANVLRLQAAVHGDTYEGAREGRFVLLNREFDFGSIEDIDWRGEFHEGNNPLRRMNLAYMGYAVPLLARGRAGDLDVVQRILGTLVDRNPWSEPGVFRDVWNPYTASHRLINLLSALALFRRAGGTPDAAAERDILEHVRFCAAFVRANLERDLQFNHLMKNYVALTAYAAMCDAVPWPLIFLRDAVPRTIRQNVLGDGGHAERCPMYHLLSLLDVRVFAASGMFVETWQPLLDETHARMMSAVNAMALADGEIALMNDSWIGEAPRPDTLVNLKMTEPVERLPETGYLRLGLGGDSVVFDCGPCGPDENPGHAHADFLSVEATAGGRRLLVDTGVPTYTAGPARDLSRAAAAHNGPRLDGAEPIEFWKSFRVGRRGYAGELDIDGVGRIAPLCSAGWQSGYAHLGVDVRRLVALWPGEGLLIADLWTGGGTGAATRFLIPGEWRTEDGPVLVQEDLRVAVRCLLGEISAPVPASHWYRFGVEREGHRLDVRPERTADGFRAAVLFDWSAGARALPAGALDRLFADLAAAIPLRPDLG